MELSELKICIDSAIDKCQSIIEDNPNVILTEADFERLIANCISCVICENKRCPQDNDFSVHTQISHYVDGKVHPDARPDILLLKESKLIESIKGYIPHKLEKYNGPSIAIELKYLHVGDCTSKVQHDFDKWKNKLNKKNWLYVIVLLDSPCKPKKRQFYENKRNKIIQLYNMMIKEHPQYSKNILNCSVLRKAKKT